uniref:Peptidase S1 domain-containing protein n=1 Tax=Glossina brevipalpis TaxID=37001 RepID=A0A1A9WUP5_9MUSC
MTAQDLVKPIAMFQYHLISIETFTSSNTEKQNTNKVIGNFNSIADKDPALEKPTRYTRNLVEIFEEKYRKIGTILSKDIVVTDYEQDFVNYAEPKKYGSIQFRSKNKLENTRRRWRKTINYINSGIYELNQPGIALVKINRDIKLERDSAEIINLSKSAPETGSICNVVGFDDSDDEIVQIQVTVVDRNKCKERIPNLYNETLCIILPHHNHCHYLLGGDPVICKGRLAGIVSRKDICNASFPRPCASIYHLLSWIESTKQELHRYPPTVSALSAYSQHTVYLGWPNKYGAKTVMACGVILSENIVLTSYTNERENEEMYGKNKKIDGYIVFGIPKYLRNFPKVHLRSWSKSTNYESGTFPKPFGIQLAIIRTDENMKLNERANPMPLPGKPVDVNAECVVVGLGEAGVVVETKAIIMHRNKCVQILPNAYDGAICVDLPRDSDLEDSHCTLFFDGSPLVCNGELTGMISWQEMCNGIKPRIAASIYKFKGWIMQSMEKLQKSSNMKQEPKIAFRFFLSYITFCNSLLLGYASFSSAIFYIYNSTGIIISTNCGCNSVRADELTADANILGGLGDVKSTRSTARRSTGGGTS